MQGGAASICGAAGCHFGVRVERWGFKTFIARDVNEIFSLALACKSLLLHVTWARETARSACFWNPLDTLGTFFCANAPPPPRSRGSPAENRWRALLWQPPVAPSHLLTRTLHGERVRVAWFHSSQGFKHALALYVS